MFTVAAAAAVVFIVENLICIHELFILLISIVVLWYFVFFISLDLLLKSLKEEMK